MASRDENKLKPPPSSSVAHFVGATCYHFDSVRDKVQ